MSTIMNLFVTGTPSAFLVTLFSLLQTLLLVVIAYQVSRR
jgi:hypothetical protein